MYSTQFFPMLVRHLGHCRLLKAVPFEFDEYFKKLVPIKNSSDIKIFRCQCLIMLLYVVAMFLNLCVGPLTVQRKFQGFSFFAIYVILLLGKWNYELDIAPIQVINSCMQFETELVKGG